MINRNVVLFSEMALNKNISYGSFIYELIKYNLYFPYILSSLDKTEVISNDNTNKKISAEEQMLYLLLIDIILFSLSIAFFCFFL